MIESKKRLPRFARNDRVGKSCPLCVKGEGSEAERGIVKTLGNGKKKTLSVTNKTIPHRF